jgi:hypothetical protein
LSSKSLAVFTVLSMVWMLFVSCAGNKGLRFFTVVDYTHSQYGAYMMNFNRNLDDPNELKGVFSLQYFSPTEVSLRVDSSYGRWIVSGRKIESMQVIGGSSGYNGNPNATGAGPFAWLTAAGGFHQEWPSNLDTLSFSLFLTVVSLPDSSIVERFPIMGKMVVAPKAKKKST